jgi:hypothetical protein
MAALRSHIIHDVKLGTAYNLKLPGRCDWFFAVEPTAPTIESNATIFPEACSE